ncbi:prepilin-type N-terminal cleavage/methylation domain-containing protein [Microbacterium sp. SSM24]|uniref:prepilin-type N-terminal cleavage/methylation domain-containing protein n=1 Tax=Microbacterium sp. SSM24 TaxID=2991714 RepID=UPI002227BEFF|nr:prepilin-type N-terminal cleavage/methylation domain-containing protein [Microbacterium sp. SSM24]MCW3494794.1 prepilin-type N-terminal cleavage/methylation domain-containing protein [Microbacterium sp. SSM24]
MFRREDDGFSLVEVIIAMFLLMVLALAVLPLIIGATRVSGSNKDLVAATTFANAQLAPIRAAYSNNPTTPTSCSALVSTYARTGLVDPAGTGLRANVIVSTCPTGASLYPAVVTVTARVYDVGEPSTILATVPTKVMVSGS